MLVHNVLTGLGLRDRVRIIASAKIISAFDMARVFALGADTCNIGRGFMFSLGCIQAQACHTGHCPTGVTSQDPGRYKALHIEDKAKRVAAFHANTLNALSETIGAAGQSHPSGLAPDHLMIRINSREVRSARSQYDWIAPGELLEHDVAHPAFAKFWTMARADSFAAAG